MVSRLKGRSLQITAHLKKRITRLKADANCLAHTLIIVIAKITSDPDYKAYIKGRKIHRVVDNLLATTGINLGNGGGIPEVERFQDHFRQYEIVVYTGLNCDRIMFERQIEMSERINLLYDGVTRHYHVIGKLMSPWPSDLCVKRVARGVVETSCTPEIKYVVIAWRFLHVYRREL
jgi:hypothetical protein